MKTVSSRFFYALCCFVFTACMNRQPAPQQVLPQQVLSVPKNLANIKSRLHSQIAEITHSAQQMDSLSQLTAHAATDKALQESFHQARVRFKRVEWAIEYFAATTAHELNGAPIDELEPSESVIIPATGFQVLESYLFPVVKQADSVVIRYNTRIMLDLLTRAEKVIASQELTDAHIFDAIWLEVARVQTLGITGFDSPIRLTAIQDAAIVLESLGEVLEYYHTDSVATAWKPLHNSLAGAIGVCKTNTDFTTFDRADWFSRWVNPLARHIKELQTALHIAPLHFSSAFRPDAKTMFDSAAFNVLYFAPPYVRDTPPKNAVEQTKLGERLFYDPILSGDETRSCATCHQPERAFTDGLAHSKAMTATGTVKRNAPTILNAALQTALFADLRVVFLEDQASDVVQNADEMHGSFTEAVRRLERDTAYKQAFARSFNEPITELHIKQALAAYERSLVAMNSPFDRYMRGDTTALTTVEKHGFNLYMGKAKCGTCHFVPLFNGTVPPEYTRTEQEVIGVPLRPLTAHARIDTDLGRYALNKYEKHRYAFKTPTVRNSALTAPYMHNGVFTTLSQVMDFYNRGGGIGIGIRNLEHQTLAPEPLQLSIQEQQAVIAFLHALTDTTLEHRNSSKYQKLATH
jgi:cytochrome c peroxidase